MAEQTKSEGGEKPIVIKKYANRRLYNTATSSYVTLDHLCKMVKDGVEFVVYDAKTGEDITRAVLTQIIVEEEAKGHNLLPINFLRQLISFYGDNLQWVVPRYLEHTMSAFARNQERMRTYLQDAFGGLFPFGPFEEMGKQNLALFENAMRMFTPFSERKEANGEAREEAKPVAGGGAPSDDAIRALRSQVDLLQRQLDALSRGGRGGEGDKSR